LHLNLTVTTRGQALWCELWTFVGPELGYLLSSCWVTLLVMPLY